MLFPESRADTDPEKGQGEHGEGPDPVQGEARDTPDLPLRGREILVIGDHDHGPPRMHGELSPHQVARRAGVHIKTVYRWARIALGELAGRSPLAGFVRRDATGHIWVDENALRRPESR